MVNFINKHWSETSTRPTWQIFASSTQENWVTQSKWLLETAKRSKFHVNLAALLWRYRKCSGPKFVDPQVVPSPNQTAWSWACQNKECHTSCPQWPCPSHGWRKIRSIIVPQRRECVWLWKRKREWRNALLRGGACRTESINYRPWRRTEHQNPQKTAMEKTLAAILELLIASFRGEQEHANIDIATPS